MDLSLHIRSNPNANKNRIPEKTELNALRDLAQYNLQLISDLDRQLEQQRIDYVAIQRRYEEQIQALEKQKQALETELSQIKGLIHPIRSCPSDIIRHIFECTVEMLDVDWFSTATALSHVCQRWRNIALDTPYLWTALNVSLEREPNKVKEFWERTVARVKVVPVAIFVADVNGANHRWRVMEECNFDVFPHIELLEFKISNRDAVVRFASPQLHPPTGRLEELLLHYTDEDRDAPLDLSPIISRFFSATSLTLTQTPMLTFGAGFVAPTVTKLTLERTSASSMNILAQTFPNAEEVNFQKVKLHQDTGGIVNWPKMRSLLAWDSYEVPWGSLRAPKIRSLTWSGAPMDSPEAFITLHKSLQHLDIEHYQEHMDAIIAAAPQLLTLAIDSCEEISDKSIMALDKLIGLTVYHGVEAPLTLDMFEKIMRSHFLPGSNKWKSKDQGPSLTVLIEPNIEINDIEWLKSGLLSSTTQSVSTVRRWARNYRSYSLNWNTNSA